jgi:DNA topoisomerase-1
MMVAQQLYEGMNIGGGEAAGLITYMRTDSVNLANEALENIRQLISQKYGADQVPPAPRAFKTKSKNAQEAHEAIRPTLAEQIPAELKKYLSSDQFKLWQD